MKEAGNCATDLKTINPFGLPYEERWTEEKVEESAKLFGLDASQKEQLLELRDRLADLRDYWMNGPFELSRFVLEPTCSGKVATMDKRFRKCREWRIDNNIDTILETYSPPGYAYKFPGGVLQDTDRDGDWVVVTRNGEPLELIRRHGKEEIIQALLWGNEFNFRGPWLADHAACGKRPTIGTAILDLKGLSPRHYHPALLTIAANVAQPLQLHYPYMLKKILVVNAPWIAHVVWNKFLKHLVFAHLRELIEIAATEEQSEELVDKYVDLQILPAEMLGGKGTGKAVQPWLNPRWEIGLLPPEDPANPEKEWERPPLVYGADTIWQQQARKQRCATEDTASTSGTSSVQSSSSLVRACGVTLLTGTWAFDGPNSTTIQIRQ